MHTRTNEWLAHCGTTTPSPIGRNRLVARTSTTSSSRRTRVAYTKPPRLHEEEESYARRDQCSRGSRLSIVGPDQARPLSKPAGIDTSDGFCRTILHPIRACVPRLEAVITPDGSLTIVIVAVDPPPPSGTGLAAGFAAAAATLGVRAIEDIAIGPGGTIMIVIGRTAGATTRLPGDLGGLRAALVTELRSRGCPSTTVEIATLSSPHRRSRFIREAMEHWVAHFTRETTVTAQRHAFRAALSHLLETNAIRTLFQPIIDVQTRAVVGYEALSRGPEGHPLETAPALLNAAELGGLEGDAHLAMARFATTRARQRFSDPDLLLFINMGPTAVWKAGDEEPRRSPHSIWPLDRTVIEMTERAPIHDVGEFLVARRAARALGLRLALDDAGAGYAGLATLAVANPEFIKIDMSLVRGCDGDSMKQDVISALVHLSRRSQSRVIAEGVESMGEFSMVRRLGVHMVQGFLFAPPAEQPPIPAAAGTRPARYEMQDRLVGRVVVPSTSHR